MLGVYKDPEGESVFNKTTSGGGAHISSSQMNTNVVADRNTIDTLRKRVRELEGIVNTKKVNGYTVYDLY